MSLTSGVGAANLVWPEGGVTLLNLPSCLSLLSSWLAVARSSLSSSLLLHSFHTRASRVGLLRSGAVAQWAKRMRTPGLFKPYYPSSVRDSVSGPPRPPLTVSEHLLGAEQEWARVLQEPGVAWSSNLVHTWVDSLARQRGTLSWARVSQLVPDSLAFRVARAYCQPGPCVLHIWRSSDVSVLSAACVRVSGWLYNFSEGQWWAFRQGPTAGRVHLVLQVAAGPSSEWDVDRWYWVSTLADLSSHSVLRVCEPVRGMQWPLFNFPSVRNCCVGCAVLGPARLGLSWNFCVCFRLGCKSCFGRRWICSAVLVWWLLVCNLLCRSTFQKMAGGGGPFLC